VTQEAPLGSSGATIDSEDVSLTKLAQLRDLEKQCFACRKCAIGGCLTGSNLSNVFSNMCPKARIMVVGQNPGAKEVELRRPFVGPSGAFFDKCIKDVLGIDRSRLYISNIVRCYTPGNRAPKVAETSNCRDILDQEIEILKPELVVTLGGYALKQVTGLNRISQHHGEIVVSPRYSVKVLPLYHPSPINMNNTQHSENFRSDLELVRDFL